MKNLKEKRFGKVNQAYASSSRSLFRLMATAQPGFFFLFNIVMILIIWTGSIQIDQGQLQVGDLIAFIEYIFHALFSFMTVCDCLYDVSTSGGFCSPNPKKR